MLTDATQHEHAELAQPDLRTISLAHITVRDGHNPRERFADADLDRLAHAITTRGFLHPVLLTPTDEPDRFELVDGERRFRAAQRAGITEIPALVKASASGDSKNGGDLVDAILANDLTVRLDPVEEARGYERLITDAGYTRKGVAAACRVPVERIRERLAILELPEPIQQQVADGVVPLRAVKPLAQLAKIHAAFPAAAVQRVLARREHPWDVATTWEDLTADPIAVTTAGFELDLADLPDDVFTTSTGHPLERFTLTEEATRDADELCHLTGLTPNEVTIRFDRPLVEQAEALGAAHGTQHRGDTLIVGADVADQLAADYLRRCVELQRENARHLTAVRDPAPAAADAASEEERKAERRREREAALAARAAARAQNEVLGTALVKHLSRLKPDEKVMKVVSAAPLSHDLRAIAARGARYGFPGWVGGDDAKPAYCPPTAAEAKAREFLAGAKTAADVAGRCFVLIAMARWADETAVAQSQRSFYDLRFDGYGSDVRGVPWRGEVPALIDEILLEHLPHEASEPIRRRLEADQEPEAIAG